jgi:hypothetical protein
MYKYVLLLAASLLTLPGKTYAQKISGDQPQWYAMRACAKIAINRARKDFKETLELAKKKDIGVIINVQSNNFSISVHIGNGDMTDKVIFNYYCTCYSDTATTIDNCLGALVVGSMPLSVQK